jgi:hypothetical protein
MPGTGEILKNFYAAIVRRDIAEARSYLNHDLEFVGLFKTYRSADEYIAALTGLLQVTVRLEVKTIIAEGTVLVAEWHQFENGKISRVASAFDGRPYAAMFAGKAGA